MFSQQKTPSFELAGGRRRSSLAKALLAAVVFCLLTAARLHGQAHEATASRAGDLQVGGGFAGSGGGYYLDTFKGFFIYTTFDFRNHFGAEFELHQMNASDQTYERTYQIGPRYVMHFLQGRLNPFGKFSFGRGVQNYRYTDANLAYNMYGFGGGVDIPVTRGINVRGEYEYENWLSFPTPGQKPSVISIGAAYHFH